MIPGGGPGKSSVMAHPPDPEETHVGEPRGAELNPNPNLPDAEPHDSRYYLARFGPELTGYSAAESSDFPRSRPQIRP